MKGVELGGANSPHPDGNSFFLKACINIAPAASDEPGGYYATDETGHRGFCHLHGHAAHIPLFKNHVDYVISSHVMEHVPDPIQAWYEWERVVRPGGYFLMIVPHHDALASDERPLEMFTLDRIWRAHTAGWHWGAMRMPMDEADHPVGGPYGHWWKFTPDLLKEAIAGWCPNWSLCWEEDPDSKIGNGFFLAYQLTT